jgi:hypothetical protein
MLSPGHIPTGRLPNQNKRVKLTRGSDSGGYQREKYQRRIRGDIVARPMDLLALKTVRAFKSMQGHTRRIPVIRCQTLPIIIMHTLREV